MSSYWMIYGGILAAIWQQLEFEREMIKIATLSPFGVAP